MNGAKRRRAWRGLCAGAALALAACTPSIAPEAASPEASPEPPAIEIASPTTPAVDRPAAEPTVPPIDPDAVAAQFAGIEPTSWGLDIEGVVGTQDSDGIALTLDACGGPRGSGYDKELIDGLIERGIPATLFLNHRWIEANRETARALAENPLFELGNHGTGHRPLSVTGASAYGIAGTNSAAEVVAEVWGNHLTLTELTGTPPRFFRAGTAHYDDVAVSIVKELGESVIGFSVNADGGATLSAEAVRQQVVAAGPGDIVIAHMNHPGGGTAPGILAGVDEQLARGATFVHLND